MPFLQEGKSRPGQLGPFDKKWLMLAVQDLETKTPAGKVCAQSTKLFLLHFGLKMRGEGSGLGERVLASSSPRYFHRECGGKIKVDEVCYRLPPLVPQEPLGRVVMNLADFASEDGRLCNTLHIGGFTWYRVCILMG